MTKETFRQIAFSFLNTAYKWAGDDPTGIDCSGLVQEILAAIGLDPEGDQTADALYRHFLRNGEVGKVETGSLVFYGRPEKVTHVGMIVDGLGMIEAGGGGSRTNTIQDAIDQNAFVRVRPYTRRKDLVAVIRPNGLPWGNQ